MLPQQKRINSRHNRCTRTGYKSPIYINISVRKGNHSDNWILGIIYISSYYIPRHIKDYFFINYSLEVAKVIAKVLSKAREEVEVS